MTRTARAVRLASGLAVLIGGAIVIAGPLDPPSGPVTGTMKTLDQVEARTPINPQTCPGDADSLLRITQPGSYYLTGDVQGAPGKHGIEVAASGVRIDLSGFSLTGVPGSLEGITAASGTEGIAVRNGRVTGWDGNGVSLVVTVGQRSGLVESIVASHNGGRGIHAGSGAVVRSCTAHDNGGAGISVYVSAVVEGCSALDNGGNGISGEEGTTVVSCSAGGNAGLGIYVVVGGTVADCSSRGNTGAGIWVSHGATVRGCNSYRNQGDGISVYQGCHVVGNNSYNNEGPTSAGIRVRASDNRIEGNNVTKNVYGVDVDAAGNIIVCNTARSNTTQAFSIPSGNTYGPLVSGGNGQISTTSPWANFAY